jgi:hypothetical protein
LGVIKKFKNVEREISGQFRLVLGLIGLGLAFLIAVAAYLEPSPYLMGTHQQLGLPPCSFLVIFGAPCPTCGMTTAWSCLMHGEWLRAIQANAGGVMLFVFAAAACPWLAVSAAAGRWFIWRPNGKTFGYVSAVVLIVTLVQWCFRLLGK